jgi:hypothetical protein
MFAMYLHAHISKTASTQNLRRCARAPRAYRLETRTTPRVWWLRRTERVSGNVQYLFNECGSGKCSSKFEQTMYDWWPGYKAGTLLYSQTMGDGSWTVWELLDAASVGTLAAASGVQALQLLRAGANVGIEFGANANQVSHAFRHIDAIGLSREAVSTAIRTDMSAVATNLPVGQTAIRTVAVNGVDLTYHAHRVSQSIVNVGRITPPRP